MNRRRHTLGRRVVGLGLLASTCGLVAAGCQSGKRHKMGRELVTVAADGPSAADCGGCHVQQYAEWRASAHARAWTDPVFVARSDRHRFAHCLPCHAPKTALAADALELRPRLRSEGVTCITCHLKDGRLAGPVPSTALVHPHPVATEAPLHRQSRLCGVCHEGTHKQWLAASSPKKTCQQCHMTEVRRRVTQGVDPLSKLLVSFEKPVAQRKHDFHVPQMPEAEVVDVKVDVARDGAGPRQAVVHVTNRLPHALPTGDFGMRRVVLQVRWLGADGTSLGTQSKALLRQLATAMAAGERVTVRFPMPERTRSLDVRLFRSGDSVDGRQGLLQRRITLP